MKISICIPVRNGERFLAGTIDSVLAQTFGDFEIVLRDDCSTDGSAGVMRGYAARDTRVRILDGGGASSGAEGNWNAVLQAARGDYIKILCQDDLLEPDCLQKQSAVLDDTANAGVAVVGCLRRIINASGRVMPVVRGIRFASGRMGRGELFARIVRSGTNIIGEPQTLLFRALAARRAGLFSGAIPYLIDLDYWTRLMQHGDLYVIPEPLCSFRISRTSWSSALAFKQAGQVRAFMRVLASRNPGLVSRLDLLQGDVMATVNAIGRQVFYLFQEK